MESFDRETNIWLKDEILETQGPNQSGKEGATVLRRKARTEQKAQKDGGKESRTDSKDRSKNKQG